MSETFRTTVGDMEISGRTTAAGAAVHRENPPLIVAIHGGGFTSEYFDAGEYSLLDRAAAAGVPSIAIDRPGYGASTALPHGEGAVPRNAEVLQSAIAKLWNERDYDAAGIVLVGHSIGSTTSLYLASQPTDWPLLGVAFSGLLLKPPVGTPPFWQGRELDAWVHTPFDDRLQTMFGPAGTYAPGAPELLDSVSRPVWWREIVECYIPWEDDFQDVCSRITVPVHERHGAVDPNWENGQAELGRLAGAFTNAPSVDAELVPDSGHCIDFHLTGAAMQEQQIAFAIDCAA